MPSHWVSAAFVGILKVFHPIIISMQQWNPVLKYSNNAFSKTVLIRAVAKTLPRRLGHDGWPACFLPFEIQHTGLTVLSNPPRNIHFSDWARQGTMLCRICRQLMNCQREILRLLRA